LWFCVEKNGYERSGVSIGKEKKREEKKKKRNRLSRGRAVYAMGSFDTTECASRNSIGLKHTVYTIIIENLQNMITHDTY
jgi:hypothetical protein